jgi:hypothetical protein
LAKREKSASDTELEPCLHEDNDPLKKSIEYDGKESFSPLRFKQLPGTPRKRDSSRHIPNFSLEPIELPDPIKPSSDSPDVPELPEIPLPKAQSF